jgi:hypothetical protein
MHTAGTFSFMTGHLLALETTESAQTMFHRRLSASLVKRNLHFRYHAPRTFIETSSTSAAGPSIAQPQPEWEIVFAFLESNLVAAQPQGIAVTFAKPEVRDDNGDDRNAELCAAMLHAAFEEEGERGDNRKECVVCAEQRVVHEG